MKLFFFVQIFYLFWTSNCQFNLYLEEAEAQQITGIPGELYYIRNNSIQEKTSNFKLIVPTHVNNVTLIWYYKLQQSQMFYSVSISVSSGNVIEGPVLNIRKFGKVPTNPAAIQIALKCINNGIVDVNVEFTVNSFSSVNVTHHVVKLQKICHNFEGVDMGSYNGKLINSSQLYDNWLSIERSRKMFYLGVGISCFIFFIFFTTLCICYLITKRRRRFKRCAINCSSMYDSSSLSDDSQDTNGLSLLHEINPINEKKDFEFLLAKVAIAPENIVLSNMVKEGMHGTWFEGTYTNNTNGNIAVTVKVFKDAKHLLSQENRFEVSLLHFGLDHNHVLPLLGFHSSNFGSSLPTFIYPSTIDSVCLKKYLQTRNPDKFPVNTRKLLSSPQMSSISSQICLGLIHLHNKGVVHKDVAARNCIISEDMVIKLTDGLLSEDMYPTDYEGLNFRPIRWFAPEVIQNGRYSVASDVWAFGVTMWEIACFGDQPYTDVSIQDLLEFLLAGYRLSQPIRCSNEMFSIMACCWSLDVVERTDLSSLCLFLQQFYHNLKQYI